VVSFNPGVPEEKSTGGPTSMQADVEKTNPNSPRKK
jgi:hypothetical protein